jgi:hypothetical protein
VLIAGGGHDGSAEIYAPASGTFAATGSLVEDLDGGTATLLEDSRVLVAGGFLGDGGATADAELYWPPTLAGQGPTGRGPQALPSIPVPTPVATASAWLAAIDSRDQPLVLADIVPGERSQLDWGELSPLTFSDIKCQLQSEATDTAQVLCSFSLRDSSSTDQDFSPWLIQMARDPSTTWLIENYGESD